MAGIDTGATTAQVAAVVRDEIRAVLAMIRMDLEDLDRRAAQGFPADLTSAAARGLHGNTAKLLELTGELKGLER